MARRIGGVYVPEGAAALRKKEAAHAGDRAKNAAPAIEVVTADQAPKGTIDQATLRSIEQRIATNDAAARLNAQDMLQDALKDQPEQAA